MQSVAPSVVLGDHDTAVSDKNNLERRGEMIKSFSKEGNGEVCGEPCNLLVVHYRNSDNSDKEVELKDGSAGAILMTLHLRESSSGTVPIESPGIEFQIGVHASGGGGNVAIDIVAWVSP
jgi:hypothetical protein